ncbi:hypothetical protein ELI10_13465 [Rhizobium ruizarguesonis]|nr:hypothetical protein ELI10_13465 [Rhizobium ruizarguesonis]TAX15089.1 hypothetical protein ELI09_13515 [Rhizobium ruizarguesonis]TAX19921.1 hypothetical protein ELI08_13520 [Rhizobium ruizarguesonis]
MPCGPSSALRAPIGVEPLVSTRPSDPRGEKGESRRCRESLLPSGEKVAAAGSGGCRHGVIPFPTIIYRSCIIKPNAREEEI